MLKFFNKNKKIKEYPNKRRVPVYEAELFFEMLHAQAVIPVQLVKQARIIQGASGLASQFVGQIVSIIFYSKGQCEVEFKDHNNQKYNFFVDRKYLDLSIAFYKPFQEKAEAGEYVTLVKDVYADDGSRDLIAEEDDDALLLYVSLDTEFPYWLYVFNKQEYIAVRENEFERKFEKIALEFR